MQLKSDQLANESSTMALVCALKYRDEHTQMHSQRVIELAKALGVLCGLTATEMGSLKSAACLHDIGKIGIPDGILLKPAALDEDEWDVMKSHSAKGEDIVRNLNVAGSEQVALAVRHHHENFDGSGYPDQLAGEDIPLFSRIISITDSFDAMADTRPYHQSRTCRQIMNVMHSEQGKFDPWLLTRFEIVVKRHIDSA
jgi:HD-GYP domain-containing protein (c-di-GMP phosphodiesterase class II)